MERKLAARVRAQRWYLKLPRAVPVGIFLLVSAITALSVTAIQQVETQRAEAQQRQMALMVTSAIERLAGANSVYLRAGAALLSAQPEVTRSAFHAFAAQLDHDEMLRGGIAMGWAVATPRSAIPALEQAMRTSGNPGFSVHLPSPDGMALPVIYLEPDEPANRGGLGFDIFAEPVRRAAVERAIRSGRPTASGVVDLQVNVTKQQRKGFVVYMPIYATPDAEGDLAPPRLRAVIARGFTAQKFLDAALKPVQLQGYGVEMFDGHSPVRDPIASIGPQAEVGQRIMRSLMIADRQLNIELSPPASPALSNMALLTLLSGTLVALLLLFVARLATKHAIEERAALAWFSEQAAIRDSLSRELNHRVKNALANVLSIIALTRRRTENLDEFVVGLMGRVRALSATHDLLTQSQWGATLIGDVVAAELAPYTQDTDSAVKIHGPKVELAPSDALSLGMAIHELATNASKYGALSAAAGEVEIKWAMITEKLARIEWAESGGPTVAPPIHRGFGTDLIEKIVAHELRNPVDLRFEPGGVRCTFVVPVRQSVPFQLRGGSAV